MSEIIFSFDEQNFQSCQEKYRGDRDQEYYCGDYMIDAAPVIRVEADKKAAGPFSIIRLRSTTKLSFRRTWRHIRKDGADLVVLWFVKSGRLSISHSKGRCIVGEGECVFTRSTDPFHIECLLGDDKEHETLHVVLPGHVLNSFRCDSIGTGLMLSAKSGEAFIADQIFSALYATETQVAGDMAEHLIMDALAMVAKGIELASDKPSVRQSLSQRRLSEIKNFIDLHLANPFLSTALVAKGCGISPRYLSLLLKAHGVSFSKLVWEKRLDKAKAWLAATSADDLLIGEVAHRLGFKSAAHFSRAFKEAYGQSPRDFRKCALTRDPGAAQGPGSETSAPQTWGDAAAKAPGLWPAGKGDEPSTPELSVAAT